MKQSKDRVKKSQSQQSSQASLGLNWWTAVIDQGKYMFDQMLENMAESFPLSPQSKNAMPMMKSTTFQPMAIFDPEIVMDTMTKAQIRLGELLNEQPQRFFSIQQDYFQNMQRLFEHAQQRLAGEEVNAGAIVEPSTNDKRFKDSAWTEEPYFDFLKQAYLLQATLLKDTVQNLEGLDSKTHQKVDFYTRQFVDAISPTNFPLTNPVVLREMIDSQGETLWKGLSNYWSDMNQHGQVMMTDLSAFKVGENIGITPGKVVYQNDLFQLIQYEPRKAKVAKIPLLIIPPWINKYYIFDLQPENSFVKWALESGLTVFIISWINPDASLSEKSLRDYVLEGALEAVRQVQKICNEPQINVLGHCAGGITLTLLLAYLAKKELNYIKSATVLAAPINTQEVGELLVYICEKQLDKLDAHLAEQGYLAGKAMAMSFNLLRPNDLIWSSYINNYLMGRNPMPFDMLFWSNDPTRIPARMYSEYLRWIFLENRLIKAGEKGIKIEDVDIDISQIKTPLFVFGALDDHIAPWRSVFALAEKVKGPTNFLLGASGHVAGVINPPEKEKYGYWKNDQALRDASEWFDDASYSKGSWWNEWRQWLENYTDGLVKAQKPNPKDVIEPAPGHYVMARDS